MRIAFIVTLFLLFLVHTHAQESESTTFFFPDSVVFRPLMANHEEPRVSLQQILGTTLLRVGVGNMLDVLEHRMGASRLRLGIDLFSYALSDKVEGVKLKIDAVDGFFGFHITYTDDSRMSWRFRVIHLSAHFIDGHYLPSTQQWKNNVAPVPFSRNYGELIAAYQTVASRFSIRLYSGFSYAAFVKPEDIRRWTTIHGIEVWTFTQPTVYFADNLTVMGVPGYYASNSIEAGVKFGSWNARGLRVYVTHYTGLDNFGQYYKQYRKQIGMGVALDFW